MRVTLLGHASVLVELGPGASVRCLMDPVFRDPFEDSAVMSCPRRSVNLGEIPPIDLLVLSHSHLDHFDIPSLAHIAKKSRKCDVVCPQDQAIVYALERLGFTKIHAEAPFKHLVLKNYEILTTPSAVTNVIEFGVVFKDPSGVFWNQVDTVVHPSSIEPTLKQSGPIDLLFAMYASQNFKFFESKPASFPHDMHAMNLNNVSKIAPRYAVPGSAGFRFAGPAMDWCNAFLFPVSRERFIADLSRAAPTVRTMLANPGDTFEIRAGEVEHLVGQSRLVQMVEDDTPALRFDPTAAIPALTDPNPTGLSLADLESTTQRCLEDFASYLRTACATSDPIVRPYQEARASYAIGVVFPDGRERWQTVFFGDESPRIDDPATPPEADAGHRIVASALCAWLTHEKSYFYLRAFSRKWSHVYTLVVAPDGGISTTPSEPEDLLAHYLQRAAPSAKLGFKKWLDRQLAPYVSGGT